MKVHRETLPQENRTHVIKTAIDAGGRLGVVTSIDGRQLLTVLLDLEQNKVTLYETPITDGKYHSATSLLPQAHWFERTTWDLFGIQPDGHPRLKHTVLHDPYNDMAPPLALNGAAAIADRRYEFLSVDGEGVYEIPVGPIHAGIIEPGHFRFSCYGEVILNLEIRLGYLHRGIEKRLTEIPWRRGRFVAEAAASDMPVANALANSIAIESLLPVTITPAANSLRSAALEIERVAMHLSDLIGLAGDIGFLGISTSFSRLRGIALRMGEMLSGNRLMRGYVCPGGVIRDADGDTRRAIVELIQQLRPQFNTVIDHYMHNQVALDRMESVGKVTVSLAREFGLVGVAARASGVVYDCRSHWSVGCGLMPPSEIAIETTGDVYARVKIRMAEILVSLKMIESFLTDKEDGSVLIDLPDELESSSASIAIVESHRGELIHLVLTDEQGQIIRYCIKDASINNWTGLSIAIRNNLVADFPLCNKSFSLSYSAHDL